jgi:ABC-2 type transport system permease protein
MVAAIATPTTGLRHHGMAAVAVALKELQVQARYRNKFLSDVLSHFLGIAPILLITFAMSGSSVNGSAVTDLTRNQVLFVLLGYTAFVAFGFGTPIMLYTGMAWGITQDVQSGTIERNFLAPVPRTLIVLGLGFYYMVLYAFHAITLIVLAALFLSGSMTLSGTALQVATADVLALLALSVGLGLASAGVYLLVKDGSFFLLVVHRPFMILSGAVFFIDLLPTPLKILAYANPVTYGVDAFRGALGGRDTILPMWGEVGIVFAGAAVAATLGAWIFWTVLRRQLARGNLAHY